MNQDTHLPPPAPPAPPVPAGHGGPAAGEPDYTQYAMYREAMDAYADPVFAGWLCRGWPWGAVDLDYAHAGFLLARDGVIMTGGDTRILLGLLVRELTALEGRITRQERGAAVLGPLTREMRRLTLDIRRLANAHPAHAPFRLRCACSIGGGEFTGAHDSKYPPAEPPVVVTLRDAARLITDARHAPAPVPDALDAAAGLVNLALHQLGSAPAQPRTITEGEPS